MNDHLNIIRSAKRIFLDGAYGLTELAQRFGVSYGAVRGIVTKKN